MLVTKTSSGLGLMAESIAERDWLRQQPDATYNDGGLYVVATKEAVIALRARGDAAGIKFTPMTTLPSDRKAGLQLESDRPDYLNKALDR